MYDGCDSNRLTITFILIHCGVMATEVHFYRSSSFSDKKIRKYNLPNGFSNEYFSLYLQSFTISKHLNGCHSSNSSILKENQFRRVLPRNHSSGAWVLRCVGSDAQKINHNKIFGNNLFHVTFMNEHLNSLGVRDFSDTSLICILYACIYAKTENCSS